MRLMKLQTTVLFLLLGAFLQACEQEYPTAPVVGVTTGTDEETETGVDADITVTVDLNSDNGRISDMLTGVNLLYCFERDALWAGDPDSKMLNYLKRMKSGVLRYPGGKIVEAWHWDNPNGQFSQDSWNPAYNPSNDKADTEFMDLEEYMAVVRELNAEPLIGINITSGKKWKNDVQASVAEAKALVQHCVDNGYGVKYYYIGNEPYHTGATLQLSADEYGEEINRFAAAIHEIDPDAQIVANWDRNVTAANMGKLLNKAGQNIDIMEIHWYWSWGTASWDLWKSQIPMSAKNQWYTGGKPHYEEVQKFNEFAKKLGYDHIKFASLEWNIAPSANEQSTPNKFQMALMQSEMLMQFMEGGLCMATFWPLHYDNSSDIRYMLDAANGYEPRYTIDVFAMIAPLQGGTLLSRTTTTRELYTIVSKADDGTIRVAMLNKNFASRKCALNFKEDFSGKTVSVECFREAATAGEAQITTDLEPTFENGMLIVDMPSYSLAVLTIK